MAWVIGLAAAAAAARAAPPPIEHFTKPAAVMAATLSPSGQRLAVLQRADTGRVVGIVVNLATGDAKQVAGFTDADVTSMRWVNDQRLVYEAFRNGPVINENGAGVFASDHDGSA